ncbi:MAG: DNA mismatch repair endonuclease MutL [Butyrivibrio sp.]|nr:DNA mismatch repair endonuclease MutL [Butyrivibrio sp.]
MPINLLDRNTINKIAAGEVVERPSSVVKELVENAIDAGADAITVEIKDGGTSFIRITDNGCGIEADEVRLAFKRHSTSKIKDAADLASISSLGFRGEALSSISAVAQTELITKTARAVFGVRYRIEGGEEKLMEEIGAPDGTTFIVRNLFYNTPARRKFLKTPTTEGGYVSSVIEQLCLSHPEISFRLIVNNQPKLQTMGSGNLKDVIYTVFGRDITANLIELDRDFGSFSIGGFIGKPSVCRGSRSHENYYINGRYIKNGIVSKAIEEAYSPFIMQHKYPFTSLHISIDPTLLDVNVHPSKMELRFANAPVLFDALKDAVSEALSRRELIPEVTIDSTVNFTRAEARPVQSAQAPKPHGSADPMPQTDAARAPQALKRLPEPFETHRAARYAEAVKEAGKNQAAQLELFERPELLKEQNEKNIRIIGQAFETYWIMEFEKNMYIVDQHAAHEKVLYEEFMRRYKERTVTTQYISPPVIVSVTAMEENILRDNLGQFTALGFELEGFGGGEYSVSGIPADFSSSEPKELLLEILDDLAQDLKKSTPETVRDRIATMACKAAVKGSNRLSHEEAHELLCRLMKLENPYNCPHGRPTMITLSKYELEKKFKRIV